MALLETEQQTSLFLLDCLYCEEKCCDDDDEEEYDDGTLESSTLPPQHHDFSSFEEEDDENQLFALFSKEEETLLNKGDFDASGKLLMIEVRREILEWMMKVNSHHGFSANTLVLGADYFDRFMLSFGYQSERPWMTQLVAVACLSLASKVEETHVPLLLDFQVECKYMFEAKTIQRMELLVLSTLKWKMNAVTPLSYFEHLMRKLKLKTHLHWEILCRYETLILSTIVDPRFLHYAPSVLAAATMVQTLEELGLWSSLQHPLHIMDDFKLNKDKVEECYKFIQELSTNMKVQKRKCIVATNSPNNVLDVVVCSENSISLLSSPEPLPKKSRTLVSHFFG